MKNLLKKLTKAMSITLALATLFGIMPHEHIATAIHDSKLKFSIPTAFEFDMPLAENIEIEYEIPPAFTIDESALESIEALEESASRQSPTSSSSSTSSDPLSMQTFGAPFSYDYNQSERVNLNSGGLVYEQVDYVLPGRNGLDLVIGRRYESDVANVFNPVDDSSMYYPYCVPNNTNIQYGLGLGWTFMFSSIQFDRFLHLADGRSFEVQLVTLNAEADILGHTLSDLRLVWEPSSYHNGSVPSVHTLYYKDGRKEFFCFNGRLIGIMDRYGNVINIVHGTQNGLPLFIITDTLDRVTTISGQNILGGHVMTVALPGSVTLKYSVTSASGFHYWQSLTKYEDPMNVATHYGYTISVGGFGIWDKRFYDAPNYFVNLTTISHPTGAQTIYTYELVQKNLGIYGVMDVFRLTSRSDTAWGASYNHKVYSYSDNDHTGFPVEYIYGLPQGFTYYTTVTTPLTGLSVKSTFNHRHLRTNTETRHANRAVSDESFVYNTDKLLTKSTTRTYNSTNQNQFMESISMWAYDNKGNVTASWSPLALGNTANTEHKTTYIYDPVYNIPTNIIYKQDAFTTVELRNTLDPAKKNIVREEVFVHNSCRARTDYAHDQFGNVTSKWQYYNGFASTYLTTYVYDRGAYLASVTATGVFDAEWGLAAGTPGYAAGTILTRFQYDTIGRMTHHWDAGGNLTQYAYNSRGDLTTVWNPDSTLRQFAWNYTANNVTVTDERGVQTRHTFTPLGLEYEVIDVLTNGVMSRKNYDSLSRLQTSEDFIYGGRVEYQYDHLDRVTSETALQGWTQLAHTTYSYNDAVNVYGIILSGVTKTVHGSQGAPSIVTTQYTDIMGNVTNTGRILGGTELMDYYYYDYVGNMVMEWTARALTISGANSNRYEYDFAGRVTKATNAEDDFITYSFDQLGNLTRITDYRGDQKTFSYDALGRLVSENTLVQTAGHAHKTHYYDPVGNVVSERAANNSLGTGHPLSWSRVDYGYDSRGRLASVIQYDGGAIDNVTRYQYDAAGNMLNMRTGASGIWSGDGKVTTYSHDRFGNLLTVTDPMGMTESYAYTSLGRPVSKTDRNGRVTSYIFDGLRRMLQSSVTSQSGTDALSYQYALTGALRSESNGIFNAQYSYDSLGRLAQIDETGGVVKQYGYDIGDNRTSLNITVGGTHRLSQSFGYDNLNRLEIVYGPSGWAQYSYDANGNRESLTYSNGNSVVYTYNFANWVTSVTNKQGQSVISQYTYQYYADGNQRTKSDHTGRVTTYVFDGAGRLKSESEIFGFSATYQYDRNSNRTHLAVTGTENYTVAYGYDGNNRLTTETKTSTAGAETTRYQYDRNGNQLSKMRETVGAATGSETLTPTLGIAQNEINRYNGLNQLVSTTTGTDTVTYSYNPSGLRATKRLNNGAVTNFILDGGNVVLEMANGATTGRYTRGINLIASEIGGTTSWYMHNAHGDVVQLTNAGGAVTKNYSYDAFGVERNQDPNDPNPWRYCGEYWDRETGTYYLRHRYYSPRTGRFTQEDPIRAGLNWYTYVDNNRVPIKALEACW